MHFCEQRPREEWDAEQLRLLHLSLNTPVVAIDVLPVGPARAGIALFEGRGGPVCLAIAVRSLRTGQLVFYAPDEELEAERDAVVAVDAALSFAEGMGFLFDEDEIAAGGDEGPGAAIARWRDLVEDVPEPTVSHARPRAGETAPVLDLVCEVPVQGGASQAEPIDVRAADEVVLADITTPPEYAGDASAAPEPVLSKFRLVMGAIEPERGADKIAARGEEGAAAAPVPPRNSRIRLLSRF